MSNTKKNKPVTVDVTKVGSQGYKDLQKLNNEQYKLGQTSEFSGLKNQFEYSKPTDFIYEGVEKSPIQRADNSDYWGNSYWDNKAVNEEDYQGLSDLRANNQGAFSKILNGTLKAGVLTGTTFLDGTLGLLYGIGSAINNNDISKLWDNDLSNKFNEWTKASEEYLPNYYTQAEQEEPWYENIFTANFLGDKFIKNLGFTIGAFYSGSLLSGAATAAKLPTLLGKIMQSTKASKIVASGIGSLTSAVNEGRVEALNNSGDWYNLHKAKVDDKFKDYFDTLREDYESNKGKQMIQTEDGRFVDSAYLDYTTKLNQAKKDYQAALAKLNEDRAHMGNVDLALNIPILTAGYLTQFSKLYTRGFGSNERLSNLTGNLGNLRPKITKYGATKALLKNSLAEGSEEINQLAASNVSGDYYSTDVDNFVKAKIDPTAEQETLSWIKSAAEGIIGTAGTVSSWEEFFIGALTGALGMPRFRGIKNKEGNFQSPITLEGGALGAYKNYKENKDKEQKLADYLNNRVNSPEFLNYYQGLIRNQKFQKDMDNAAMRDDEFDYKNAENAQLVSDIIMFDKAGRLDDLFEILKKNNTEYSDEELKSIVENTTKTLTVEEQVKSINNTTNTTKQEIDYYQQLINDDSTSEEDKYSYKQIIDKLNNDITELENSKKDLKPIKSGPYIDKNGNALYSTEEGKKEMISKLQTKSDKLIKSLNDYVKTKRILEVISKQNLSDEQLEHLTWLKMQLNDWENRVVGMSKNIKSTVKTIVDSISNLLELDEELRNNTKEGSEEYKKYSENINKLNEFIKNLSSVTKLSDGALVASLLSDENSDFLDGLISTIENQDEDTLDLGVKEKTVKQLKDIKRIKKGEELYKSKLKEYLNNPETLNNDINNARQRVADTELNKLKEDFKSKAATATVPILKKLFKDHKLDDENKTAILKEMKDSNQAVKDFLDVTYFSSDVYDEINNNTETSEQTKQDALKLFDKLKESANNYKEVSDVNSVALDDTSLFSDSETPEKALERYNKAKYLVTTAIESARVNKELKDKFNNSEAKPDTTDSNNTTNNNTTGDDNVSTTNEVRASPVREERNPIGEVTTDDVISDNTELNNAVEDNSIPTSKQYYYKATIPELHIVGSQNGDYREFWEVEKEMSKKDYSDIYNYLKKYKAFETLNNGEVKAGDEIEFVIDPEFDETIKDKPWYKEPIIFFRHKKTGNIIGALDEANAYKFEGLVNLRKKILKEYKKHKSKELFTASSTTKVSKIMIGKLKYDNNERSLKDIPNINQEDGKPLFAIIGKNGKIITKEGIKISNKDNIKNKKGRLFLLTKNGAGEYTASEVRVKRFSEINTSDDNTYSKFKEYFINTLMSCKNEEEVSTLMQEFEKKFYSKDIIVTFYNNKIGRGITISVRKKDDKGNWISREGNDFEEEKVSIDFVKYKEEDGKIIEYPLKEDYIRKQIEDVFNKINPTVQIDANEINKGDYNTDLLKGDVLTSNLVDGKSYSTWFTTDWIDKDGKLHDSINPNNKVTPKDKTNPTNTANGNPNLKGTKITYHNSEIYVDLTTNTFYDENGREIDVKDKDLLLDITWAKDIFGDAQNGINLLNGLAITPLGKILDINKGVYIVDKAADRIRKEIEEHNKSLTKNTEDRTAKILSQIDANQQLVDKSKTDSEYYYIKEEDGEYHKYSRVHSILGSNTIESSNDSKELSDNQKSIIANTKFVLNMYIDDYSIFNNKLKSLSEKYGLDLTEYYGKPTKETINNVLKLLEDKFKNTINSPALVRGSEVDNIIRDFFNNDGDILSIKRPEAMSEEAFNNLIDSLVKIKENIDKNGETFYANNIVVFTKYSDGTRIAGELDILAVDKNGNFKIYDIKTSKYSFGNFLDAQGNTRNYFYNRAAWQKMSTREYYTLQLSAYKNLFENQYDAEITKLAILPFVLSYDKDGKSVKDIRIEKGISLTYNPEVNVPLIRTKPINSKEEVKPTEITKPTEEGNSTDNQTEKEKNKQNIRQKENNLNNINEEFDEDDDDADYRKTDKEEYTKWNKEKELKWLNKVLPQLSEEDRVKVVEGLIKVGHQGATAWGMFSKGIITLSDVAAEGTVYHEAFHVVFNLLLDKAEKQALFTEAKEIYGESDDLTLEEQMAEGFREYVMNQENRGLGRRILDFFKNLFAKITNWRYVKPSLNSYYRMINEGKYAKDSLGKKTENNGDFSTTNNDIRYREVNLDNSEYNDLKQDLTSFFSNFGITLKDVSNFDSEEPIFNALDRVINYTDITNLTDNAGYAIAFMMQHNPKIKELINLKLLDSPLKIKGIRRGIKNKGNYDLHLLSDKEYNKLDKTAYLKEIGKDIANQLRLLYSNGDINTNSTFLQKLWSGISDFIKLMNYTTRLKFNLMKNYTNSIANAVKLGDYTIIRNTDNKPGTKTKASLVDIGEAFKENPYEESIVSYLNTHGISLAGGAAITSQGTLYRPSENPLHDLDFDAGNKSKNDIENILKNHFKAISLTNTINNADGKTTYTYLVLDRDFIEKKDSETGINTIYDKKTGTKLGTRVYSELILEDGVEGKMLDFFVSKNKPKYTNIHIKYNNKDYLFSNYKNAMEFKINIARKKDIWDYNNFIPRDSNGNIMSLAELKNAKHKEVKDKVKNARIIWGHPAIGKTTYLENNDNIIEWDNEVNPKREKFIKKQIDPNNIMNDNSKEYIELKQEYMSNWENHPEYIEFLTKEWNNLKEKALKENKRLFASPLPLLSLFKNDFDLFVAIPEKQFIARNRNRGGKLDSSITWKQAIDRNLVNVNQDKLVYTNKYFSEFMRDMLGISWNTLTENETEMLSLQGWTKEEFNSITEEEKEQALKCVAF